MTAAAGTAPERIPLRIGHTPCLLSFAQQRLWFLDQLLPGGVAYNTSQGCGSGGPLTSRLCGGRSMRASAPRGAPHSLHRAGRRPPSGSCDHAPMPCPCSTSARSARGRARGGDVAAPGGGDRPAFDLARGPLWRTRLVRLGDREHVLLLAIHHIVFDGWSLGVLWQELATNYEAFVAGAAVALPPLPVQYADFAEWQRSRLTGKVLDSELAYWRRTLAGAPASSALPEDHPARPSGPARGRQHFLEIPAELVDCLTKLGRQERATLFMMLSPPSRRCCSVTPVGVTSSWVRPSPGARAPSWRD